MAIIDTILPNQEETGVVGAPTETPVAETALADIIGEDFDDDDDQQRVPVEQRP